MEIGEQYKIPILKRKWIRTNITTKIWYNDAFDHPKLDYMNRFKIYDMNIKGTVHKIHKTYVEFYLENHRILCLKTEQALQLEKFL